MLRFKIKDRIICIPTQLLNNTTNVFSDALRNSGDLLRLVAVAEDAATSVEAFDLVFTTLIYGQLDAVKLIGITTDQERYGNLYSPHSHAYLSTVRLELGHMLGGIKLADKIQAQPVKKMILEQTKAEYSDVIYTMSQIRELLVAGGVAEDLLLK